MLLVGHCRDISIAYVINSIVGEPTCFKYLPNEICLNQAKLTIVSLTIHVLDFVCNNLVRIAKTQQKNQVC